MNSNGFATGLVAPAGCEIRRVRLQDLDALVGLCRQHAEFERAEIDSEAQRPRLALALFDAPVRLHAWIALVGRQPVGYATATAEYSTWQARDYLHLDCLFLQTGRRGAGIGAALLDAVRGFARDGGYPELQWQTPAWNLDAARFYRRQGAHQQAKLRFVLRNP